MKDLIESLNDAHRLDESSDGYAVKVKTYSGWRYYDGIAGKLTDSRNKATEYESKEDALKDPALLQIVPDNNSIQFVKVSSYVYSLDDFVKVLEKYGFTNEQTTSSKLFQYSRFTDAGKVIVTGPGTTHKRPYVNVKILGKTKTMMMDTYEDPADLEILLSKLFNSRELKSGSNIDKEVRDIKRAIIRYVRTLNLESKEDIKQVVDNLANDVLFELYNM